MSWCSTRVRSSRPAARPPTRPVSSSRRTARGRCAGSRRDTVDLYRSLDLDGEPCWCGVGGIEVATTPERMQELKRRLGFARSYGIEGAQLLTPEETVRTDPVDRSGRASSARTSCPRDGIAKAVARGGGARAARRDARGRVRGRCHGHRFRHPRGTRPRRPDRPG